MILILAGTQDGREIAARLATKINKPVLVSTVSEYGGQLAAVANVRALTGKLDGPAMAQVIDDYKITLLIDATHPYAVKASETAREVCQGKNIDYWRYERPAISLPDYDQLTEVTSAVEAAEVAGRLGRVIFLTTGSRTLAAFAQAPALAERRVIARVLPDPAVLAECTELGFIPKNIIAMQGPFSQALNEAMFVEVGADVIIMKNSGIVGGSDTKLLAAMKLGLAVVVISRPHVVDANYPAFSNQVELIEKVAESSHVIQS